MMRAHARWQRRWAVLHTIRWQLTLWYVLLLALALLMFSSFLYVSLAQRLSTQHDHRLRAEQRLAIAAFEVDGKGVEFDRGDLPNGLIVALYRQKAIWLRRQLERRVRMPVAGLGLLL